MTVWDRPLDEHESLTKCICIENTHNRCGGTVLPLDYMQDLHTLAKAKVGCLGWNRGPSEDMLKL